MIVMQIKLRDLKPEVCSDTAKLILTMGSGLTCLSAVLLSTTGKHHRAIADTVVAQLISLISFVRKGMYRYVDFLKRQSVLIPLSSD